MILENNFRSVSIIIPVFNNGKTLEACLNSILSLDYPQNKYEIIVVDNNSTDESVLIAKTKKVKLLFEKDTQSSYAARNKGINFVHSDILVFTDGDCIVDRDWLKNLTHVFRNKKIGCSVGSIQSYKPQSLVELFSEREGILDQYWTLNCGYLPYGQTANMAFRKDVFFKIGLFKKELKSGGDADFCWRMQKHTDFKIKFVSEAKIYHKHRDKVSGLFRQFQKYEEGKLSLIKYYPDFKIQSLLKRSLELVYLFWRFVFLFPIGTLFYFMKVIDKVDLFRPFLKFIMALGRFIGRLNYLYNKKLSRR